MISVVIPAFNVEKAIGRCVDALLAQTLPRERYEIIVVDDGSTDATGAIAQARGGRVIRQENCGAGAARNTGAQAARGDVVLFLDADSVPDPHWVEAMAAPFADSSIAGVSGEKKTRQTNWVARLVQAEYDYKYDLIAAHGATDFVDSSTAGYRRAIFLENGGFDATMMEAEDTELSFRLAERGYCMVLARDAIAYHTHPESLLDYLRRKFQYALWRAVVYQRMPSKVASETRTPPTQKMQIVIAFALLLAAFGALVWPPLVWGIVALLMLFVATTLPFIRSCWPRDPRVALAAPLVFGLAAYAGGAGGIVSLFNRRGKTS